MQQDIQETNARPVTMLIKVHESVSLGQLDEIISESEKVSIALGLKTVVALTGSKKSKATNQEEIFEEALFTNLLQTQTRVLQSSNT